MSSIRKRNGKYQAQVRKDGQTISKTFSNKTDAIKWSKEQEVLIEQGSFTSKKEFITLSLLLTRWENEVLKNLKSWKVERSIYSCRENKTILVSHGIVLESHYHFYSASI